MNPAFKFSSDFIICTDHSNKTTIINKNTNASKSTKLKRKTQEPTINISTVFKRSYKALLTMMVFKTNNLKMLKIRKKLTISTNRLSRVQTLI